MARVPDRARAITVSPSRSSRVAENCVPDPPCDDGQEPAAILVTAMRIAIDATPMLMRSSGVKNYVYYWIRSLQQLAGTRTVSAFPFLGTLPELNHEASGLGKWDTQARLLFMVAANYSRIPILNLAS